MLKKNDIIELAITDITQDANGVGKYESMAVFVPYAAVGDLLRVKIVKVQTRYCFGIIEEIILPSPARTADDGCAVFGKCGGCSLRHIDYQSELVIKNNWVRENFRRIGKIEMTMPPILPSPLENHYRNKAIYPVATIEGKTVIGFYAKRSHRVVPIEYCPLHPAFFADITKAFVDFIDQNGISVYDELSHSGLVRALYIRHAEATGETMVTVIANGEKLPRQEQLVHALVSANASVTSIILNSNTQKTNVLLGEKCSTLYGKDTLTDTLCGIDFELSPLSFYQVNRQGAERLYNVAREFAQLTGSEVLIDLYCGAGTIGLSMADKVSMLIGVEIIPEAIENARKNALNAQIQNTHFICADAGQSAKMLEAQGIRADIVIVDPPRKGLTPDLINSIEKISPARIVMVSCDSATAARDAALFGKIGYETKRIQAVDMFPRTGHVETCVLLSRVVPQNISTSE